MYSTNSQQLCNPTERPFKSVKCTILFLLSDPIQDIGFFQYTSSLKPLVLRITKYYKGIG